LQAIESFSELGSGIHIAMQDLDIRGAGNLLGAEQSGFIADLGYETYQRILKEAVLELKTEEFADTFKDDETLSANEDEKAFVADCTIESDMELMFPATYVPQEGERISLYQELDGMERETDVMAFRKRLEDRFGKIPKEGRELIRIVTLRRIARTLGIEKINLKLGKMYVYFVGDENKAYYQSAAFGKILNYLQKFPRRCHIREISGKRSILIDNVTTVEEAVAIFTEITDLKAV
jgi:transcription-repair coupling factor (superfamily II helicase)